MKLFGTFLSASLGLLALLSEDLHAEKDAQQLFIEGLQSNSDVFERIELSSLGSRTDIALELGESTLTLASGDTLDGFRFRAPEGAEELDFVWYFNAPSSWANWYLCPVEGEFKPSFRSWMNADMLYEGFDKGTNPDRTRILQSLAAGFFKPGEEYIMWFRKVGDDEDPLFGRFTFTEPKKEWDRKSIENALGLTAMPAEFQVEELNSRGGEILLDEEFFDRGYAKNRIEDVFFNIRQTRRMQDGYFITMETAIPPCKTEPSFDEIRKRYGEPDFIQTGSEKNMLASRSGNGPTADPDIVTYFYDYFGFEVNRNDPGAIVERVVTHAHDLSELLPEGNEPSFARVPMKNLTVFFDDGREVGRIYYFLEGGKEPLSMEDPPVGQYRGGNEVLDYLGDGEWILKVFFENGSLARQFPFREHRMSGKAEGFYPSGTPSFIAPYKDGLLHGRFVKYSENSEVIEEILFVNGQPQKDLATQ